ncbi:MAG: hypothetical protein ACR2QQ_09965 [Gammaproteobacteria bacterium]
MQHQDELDTIEKKLREKPRPLFIRYSVALAGALAITVAMLLFMNDLVSRFLERDATRYFSITSFIPAPDPGRQLPDAPPAPAQAPDAPVVELFEDLDVVVEAPEVLIETETPTAGQPLILDE